MISVIIINYNGIKYAEKLVDSLNSQSVNYGEAVIIDNDSRDKSENIFIENLKNATMYKFKSNKGFARAVNTAVKLSSFENILLLNNDIYLKNDFIENALKNLESDKKTFFAPLVLNYEGKVIDSAGDCIERGFRPVKRKSGEVFTGNLKKEYVNGFSMSAAYFKKKDFIDLGMLDERFFMYFEDADFSLRALESGYRILFSPECTAYHYISASTKSRYKSAYSPQKVYWEGRNRVWMFLKSRYRFDLKKILEFVYGTLASSFFHFVKTSYFIEYFHGVSYALLRGRRK